MGRPNEKYVMNKLTVIRMSEELRKQLLIAAQSTGQTLSDYIRTKIVCPKIRPKDKSRILLAGQTAALMRELRRQGGLLKHTINLLAENPNSETIIQEVKNAANGYEKIYADLAKIYKDI